MHIPAGQGSRCRRGGGRGLHTEGALQQDHVTGQELRQGSAAPGRDGDQGGTLPAGTRVGDLQP